MKEVKIELSPKEAVGLTFGNEIKATITGVIKSIREESNLPVSEKDGKPETYICVEIAPTNIRLGGKEVRSDKEAIKDKFNDDYDKYLGLKKSMEEKGKKAKAEGLAVTGDN